MNSDRVAGGLNLPYEGKGCFLVKYGAIWTFSGGDLDRLMNYLYSKFDG